MTNTELREKLVELLDETFDNQYDKNLVITARNTADHLIANGVTVQKEAKLYWKPVDECTSNLTCSCCDTHLGCREDAKFCSECGAKFVINEAQPQKEDDVEKTCMNCGTEITKEYCEDFPQVCEHWTLKKPMTNADRIRAMSDEELGIFLGEWAEKPLAWKQDGTGECLAWLRQPAEVDNEQT